jgi:hypothetical protein
VIGRLIPWNQFIRVVMPLQSAGITLVTHEKKYSFSLIIVTLFAANTSLAATENKAIKICVNCSKALGLRVDSRQARVVEPSQVRQMKSGLIRVKFQNLQFFVDAEGGYVAGYPNPGALQTTPGRSVASPSEVSVRVMARANEIFKALGCSRALVGHDLTDHGESGRNAFARGTCTVRFWERPFGKSAEGIGNRLEITFNRNTGVVLFLVQTRGWVADKPLVKLTAAVAASDGAHILGARSVDRPRPPEYVIPDSNFGSKRGSQLFKEHRLRLAFSVTSGNRTVFIDAETGECLGGASH